MTPETLPAPTRLPALERLKWAAPGLALADLGLSTSAGLFEPGVSSLEPLERSPARARFRFPLPGSPDARGNLTGRPGALGTGWLWLTVFHAGLGELLRARCTPPRSASAAEREWNLLCHLRAHGVGTPEPLLVGARGNGFVSRHSFLLVRAPEDAFPLPRWLRTDGLGAERERGLVALGKTLALLLRSGLDLPGLKPEDIWITPSGSGECETEGPGLKKNRLPGVSIVEVRGGRVGRGSPERIEALLSSAGLGLGKGEVSRVVRIVVGEE